MLQYLAGCPTKNGVSLVEYIDRICKPYDIIQATGGVDNCQSMSLFEAGNQLKQFASSTRVQSCCWFNKNDRLWLQGKYARDSYTALLPATQRVCVARAKIFVEQSYCFEGFLNQASRLCHRYLFAAGAKGDVFPNRIF